MLLGCLLMTGGMWCYSLATNVYHFYIISSVNGIFQGLLTGVPIPRILSNWFIEKRGLAMGVAPVSYTHLFLAPRSITGSLKWVPTLQVAR